MNIGPNAQAIVDNLAGRPAETIAREPDSVQKTFAAFFTGASTPGRTNGLGRIECGHPDATAGWPGAWRRLADLKLIAWNVQPLPGKIIMAQQSFAANCMVHFQITPLGWRVRMDDVAWMLEYRAADQADKATKQ